MKAKRFIILMLVAVALLLEGCSCYTWTNFWGGDPEEKCATHWKWNGKKPEKEVAYRPCAAPRMGKASHVYPYVEGNILKVETMVPEEARINEIFDYQIKVTNLTDMALKNVKVTDYVPDEIQIKSSEPQVTQRMENFAHWMLGDMRPHESTMITVSALAQQRGRFASCAKASYDLGTCAEISIVEPKLLITKTAPSEIIRCDRIPLSYVVRNTGDGYACDLKIEDTLPAGLTTAEGQDHIKYTLEMLGPGESKEFKTMTDATKTGTFASKAVLTSRTSGTVHSNMTETSVREPVLTIAETGPSTQYIGKSLTYEITLTNKGDAIAKNTVVEAMVPEEANFSSATHNGQFTRSSPGKVTWDIGNLQPNTSRKLNMVLTSNQIGSLKTKVLAKAYCAEAVSTSAETMLSGIPGILLEVVDVADPIEVGQNETYLITVTNQGSADDTNIQVTCMLEENMQYVSSSGPTQGAVVGDKITFGPLSKLSPKAQAKWQITVKALSVGDTRFKTMMKSDQLERFVEETEATRIYQ